MTTKEKPSVLVVGATGRVGTEVCKALVDTFQVFGTTRKVPSSKLERINVKAVPFAFGEPASIENAIEISKASMVFFVTDFFKAAKEVASVEVEHGKIIIDACEKAGHVQHVVLNSVADADTCPKAVQHFQSKAEIEDYLKASSLSFSILRPVAFLENLDDPQNWNPLNKGSVKGLWPADLPLKMVACADIGKAAKVMLEHPKEWKGKTLDCVSCKVTGNELAEALSKASGVRCKYSVAVPRFLQKLFMRDLYEMVRFFEDQGYSSSIEEFKKIVPDALSPLEFFQRKGKWSNGELFSSDTSMIVESSGFRKDLLFVSTAVVAVGVFVAYSVSKKSRG